MKVLAGKTALITGASSGIGKALAFRMAEEGMDLVIAARSEERLNQVADSIRETGQKVLPVVADVTKIKDLENLVSSAIKEFKQISVLVNNAGVESYAHFTEVEMDDLVNTIQTNLTASVVLCRLIIPHMVTCGEGHIVNMASTAGKYGPAYGPAYSASKAGLITLSQSLRAEFRDQGISASSICPGFTHDGGMYENLKNLTGRETPFQIGSTTTKAVCNAVIKSIKKDLPEIIVNNPPMRPVFALAGLFPTLGDWIISNSTKRYFKKVASSRKKPEA